jgi:hypothetical protein
MTRPVTSIEILLDLLPAEFRKRSLLVGRQLLPEALGIL